MELMERVREQLGEKYAKNKKLMWEDLRKVRNGRKVIAKGRRRKKSD
jgi:hypothetical protein